MSSNEKQPNKWLIFLTIPSQMGVTIFLFKWLGSLLDEKFHVHFLMKISVVLGVFISLYLVNEQVKKINKS